MKQHKEDIPHKQQNHWWMKFSNFKDGVFGEYFHVNLADANLAKLPESIEPETAAMLSDMFSTGIMGAENAKNKSRFNSSSN